MATAAEVEFWKDMCRKESARNNKLRSEWNEAVRQQLAADDARKTAEAVANGLEWQVEELEAENAKLRELLGNVGNALFSLDVDYCGACKADNVNHPCPVYTVEGGECLYKTAMRELGVEVKDG